MEGQLTRGLPAHVLEGIVCSGNTDSVSVSPLLSCDDAVVVWVIELEEVVSSVLAVDLSAGASLSLCLLDNGLEKGS